MLSVLKDIIKIIIAPNLVFPIAAIILISAFIQPNNNFFNVRGIFKEQLLMFQRSKIQLVVFYFVPLLLAIGVVQIKLINDDIISNINLVLSIFISMFFAVISILSGLSTGKNERYNKLLKETINTILFECILCIIVLILTFIELFINDYTYSVHTVIMSGVIYYLVFVIILNIFLVMKRVKVLLDEKNK